jgi:hypothetical protein
MDGLDTFIIGLKWCSILIPIFLLIYLKDRKIYRVQKLTKKLLRGEMSMEELSKIIESNEPVVNNRLSTHLFKYNQQKQLESSLGAAEFSRCASIVQASFIEQKAFENNHTIICMNLLQDCAKSLSEQEKTLLSAKLIESPLVFLEEMQKISEARNDNNLEVADAITKVVNTLSDNSNSAKQITDESVQETNSTQKQVEEKSVTEEPVIANSTSANVSQLDTTANVAANKFSTEEIAAMNKVRDSEMTLKELSFRALLPGHFTNGIQSALRSYNFDLTSDWEISQINDHDLGLLVVDFRSKRNENEFMLEAYDFLLHLQNERKIANENINSKQA